MDIVSTELLTRILIGEFQEIYQAKLAAFLNSPPTTYEAYNSVVCELEEAVVPLHTLRDFYTAVKKLEKLGIDPKVLLS